MENVISMGARAPFASPKIAMVVLTEDMRQRLLALNQAARLLRAMGVRVLSEDVGAKYRPLIVVDGTQRRSLLDALRSKAAGQKLRMGNGSTTFDLRIADVTVRWTEVRV